MRLDPRVKERLKQAFIGEMAAKKQVVRLVSPYALSKEEQQTIIAQFPQFGGSMVENVVDATLLGGFTLTQGSKTIDLSVRSVLHTLEKTIS